MPHPVTAHSSRLFALLLGSAALSLALATSAHAEVMIDQQQLTGQGKTIAEQSYGDAHQVRSPLGANALLPNAISNEPVVISSSGYGPQSSIVESDQAKTPIALKPLPKWGLAAPAQPISTGARTAILLKPPSGGANNVINQLAQQSPLRLRPPAPIPPIMPSAPQYAQAPMSAAPVMPPMAPQFAQTSLAPMPSTQVAMPAVVAPSMAAPTVPSAPQTQMAMNAAPVAASVPVSQMGELRAEDVVALDLGAPSQSAAPTVTKASAPVAPSAPTKSESFLPTVAPPTAAAPAEEKTAPVEDKPDTLPEVPKFMSPLEDETPADVKQSEAVPQKPPQTASAEPQFISPLTEGLPTDEDSSRDKPTKMAMTAPAPAMRESKREEPQIDTAKETEKLEPVMPAEKKVAAAKNVLPPLPAAPLAPPAPPAEEAAKSAQKLIEPAKKTQNAKTDEIAATHASADQAAEAVVESLQAPIEQQNKPVPVAAAAPEEKTESAKDITWSGERVEAMQSAAKTDNAEMNVKLAAALEEKAAAEKGRQEAEALAKLQAENAARASLQAEKARQQVEADAAAAKARAVVEAKAAAEQQAKIIAEAEAKAKLQAEIKAKAEAETKMKAQADEMARQQQQEIARIKADAEAKNQAQADAMAKAQSEAIAQAQIEAETRAKRQAAEIANAQSEALVKTQIAKEKANTKTAKINQEEISERARQQLAQARERLENEMATKAVPMQPVEMTAMAELSKIAPKQEVQQAAISSGAVNDAGKAMAETQPLVQQTVLFQSGVSALPGDANQLVRELSQQMKNNRDAKMIINAYADGSTQAGAAARRLSLQRAVLMRDALNKQGVPISRVEVRAQTAVPGEINPDRVDITLQ